LYQITIKPGRNGDIPVVQDEKIALPREKKFHPLISLNKQSAISPSQSPYVFPPSVENELINNSLSLHPYLASMRFFDFLPENLRKPSIPGYIMLGDRGENLSSVLQHILTDPVQKRILLYWLQQLTPMDVVEIEFENYAADKIALVLVEKNGMRVTANSASDGTLRFLAMLTAFLSPNPPRLCFLEEIETGINPTRQYLLVDFLEKIADEGKTQIIATTHSPQILSFLSKKNYPHASFLYRDEDRPDAKIIPILNLPDAVRVFEENILGELYSGGWFENSASCMDEEHES